MRWLTNHKLMHNDSSDECFRALVQLRPHWGLRGADVALADVAQMFHAFRIAGLRLHYWP